MLLQEPACRRRSQFRRLQTQGTVGSLDEFLLQLFKRMNRRKLREFGDHVIRRMEQNPGIRLTQHRGVVLGIPRRAYPVVEALEGQHRLALGIFLA